MKFTGILAAAAMIAGTIAPAAAAPVVAPAAASKLSLTRAATPTVGASKIAGEGPYLSLLIAAVAIGGLLALNSALGDEDQADSN